MRKRQSKCRPFTHDEQVELAKIIRHFVPLARNENHFLCNWAQGQIAGLIWCWTAAAIDLGSGKAKNDAFKYDAEVHPASTKALKVIRGNSTEGLRHEHAVPRSILAQHIVNEDMHEAEIAEFLRKHCHAAIIVTSEDDQLSKAQLRKRMPSEWALEGGDPYAWYEKVGLLGSLTWPSRHPCAR
jgi:hypothetical protein